MKGPGHRHRFDVHRTWECPACQRRVQTKGSVVTLACDCLAKNTPPQQTWMKLLEELPTPKAPLAAPAAAAPGPQPEPTEPPLQLPGPTDSFPAPA